VYSGENEENVGSAKERRIWVEWQHVFASVSDDCPTAQGMKAIREKESQMCFFFF